MHSALCSISSPSQGSSRSNLLCRIQPARDYHTPLQGAFVRTLRRWYNGAMSTFSAVLAQLEQERAQITSQLTALSNALAVLNGSTSNGATRRKTMSPAARARIAAAQRARWANVKNKKVVSITAGKKKRKMSASAIARIRAGQKARWAKWKRQQKKRA